MFDFDEGYGEPDNLSMNHKGMTFTPNGPLMLYE